MRAAACWSCSIDASNLPSSISALALPSSSAGVSFQRSIRRPRAYLALREKGGQHRRVPVHSRAAAAGIGHDLGCHSCRATGITAYLVHGGTLERAAAIAGHASTRTTQLYDRRRELIEPEEIERVQF
jgi:integrase